jgi:hypothetical protein
MTVKPLFGHGLDVTELPGISGWLVSFPFDVLFKFSVFNLSPHLIEGTVSLMYSTNQDRMLDVAFGQTLVEVRF